jgi:hypothetical protein
MRNRPFGAFFYGEIMAARIDERTQFVDDGGNPIVNGKIYIGVAGLDPKLNPLDIYSDRELTVPLENPQPTDAYGRSTAKIWVPDKYSIKVEDEAGNQVLQDLDSGTTSVAGYTSISDILGTNDITGSASFTISQYIDLQIYVFRAFADNDAATTLNIDGVGAKPVTRSGGAALVGGEIKGTDIVMAVWNEEEDRFEIDQILDKAVTLDKMADFTRSSLLVGAVGNRPAEKFLDDGRIAIGNGLDIVTTILKASNVPYTNTTSGLAAEDVQDALDEVAAYGAAAQIDYDNSASGLTATDVQDALDEVAAGGAPVSLTAISPSGTSSFEFDIPAGAKRISLLFSGIKRTSAVIVSVRLSTAAGEEATGYGGSTAFFDDVTALQTTPFSSGFYLLPAEAQVTAQFSGEMTLSLLDGDTWVCQGGACSPTGGEGAATFGGGKTLAEELTKIRILVGSGTFNAGTVNVMYE